MSVSTRLISGSAASWAQIGITFITQMLLVPVYLSYWDVATYGLWLAILTLGYLLIALDFGHQEFLAYELLRIGKQNRKMISRYLYSDRKSTRLNSSHVKISYAVSCWYGSVPDLQSFPTRRSSDLRCSWCRYTYRIGMSQPTVYGLPF